MTKQNSQPLVVQTEGIMDFSFPRLFVPWDECSTRELSFPE